eukprot:1161361-Pelagomonas_calceolata.AAC.3
MQEDAQACRTKEAPAQLHGMRRSLDEGFGWETKAEVGLLASPYQFSLDASSRQPAQTQCAYQMFARLAVSRIDWRPAEAARAKADAQDQAVQISEPAYNITKAAHHRVFTGPWAEAARAKADAQS